MALKCPFDSTHKSFPSRESLAAHIQTMHQDVVDGGIEPIPTIDDTPQNTITKVTQNIDNLEVPPPISSVDDLAAYNAKTAQPSTEELKAMLGSQEQKPEPEPEKKEATPVALTYKYTGDCPTCYRAVETLFLDADAKTKMSVIAYCINCKQQIKTMTVSKIGGTL